MGSDTAENEPGAVTAAPPETDPRSLATNSPETDPDRWGHSLANAIELIVRCLDAAGANSVTEVGAFAGDLTEKLLEWASGRGATVTAIEPKPTPPLITLEADRPELTVVRATSSEALLSIDIPDAVIIDGDHNYFTVSEELRIIGERVGEGPVPLLIFHDVCWPVARRDAYYVPERIPEADRQPMVEGGTLFPGDPGITPGGLPYNWVAEREGGARNGVLTAIEDFVAGRPGLSLAVIPVFFGVGVAWENDRPWSDAVERIVAPLDRDPVIARLEANRVFQLARHHLLKGRFEMREHRLDEIEVLLRELLESSAFRTADRMSQLRRRGAGSWREQIEHVLRGFD